MYKILHIPTALYINELMTDDPYTTYKDKTEAELVFKTNGKFYISELNHIVPISIFVDWYTPNTRVLNRHEFEIVEVDDV